MKYCKKCGNELRNDNFVCENCGSDNSSRAFANELIEKLNFHAEIIVPEALMKKFPNRNPLVIL